MEIACESQARGFEGSSLRNTIFYSQSYPEITKISPKCSVVVEQTYGFIQAYYLSAMPWQSASPAGEDGVQKMQNSLCNRRCDTDTTFIMRSIFLIREKIRVIDYYYGWIPKTVWENQK